MRRYPLYVLVDVSCNLSPEARCEIQNALYTLRNGLRRNAHALESVYVSIIPFDSACATLNMNEAALPLTEVFNFQVPCVGSFYRARLGEALITLTERAQSELHVRSFGQRGDCAPVVVILTGSSYFDDLEKALQVFRSWRWSSIVAFTAGDNAEYAAETLMRIAEDVRRVETDFEDFVRELDPSCEFITGLLIGCKFSIWSCLWGEDSTWGEDRCKHADDPEELPPPPPEIHLIQP